MSIQDDVKYVKKELSGDEKVLESAFKIEEFYKKYKFLVWGVVATVLLYFIATAVMDGLKQAKLEEANSAFLILQKSPDNKEAQTTLEAKNPALFELYMLSQAAKRGDAKILATLAKSKNSIIADTSKYTIAAIEKKPVDSKLYKELSLLEEAYLAIKSGNVKSAKEKLQLIDERSPLSMLAKLLEHSTIKAK